MIMQYKITTREMLTSDIEQTLKWMKDSENSNNFSKAFTRDWIEEVVRNGKIFVVDIAPITKIRKTTSIGNVAIHDINNADNNAMFAVLIGAKGFKGKGFGYKASKIIIAFGFNHLSLHKINSVVFPSNKASMRLHKKLGFTDEGTQKEQIHINGGLYTDLKLFGLLKHELKPN